MASRKAPAVAKFVEAPTKAPQEGPLCRIFGVRHLSPMGAWHRFDLIDSSYTLGLMCDVTPAWREVYEKLLDGLLRRYIAYWGCIDWMETLGDDPDRDGYPESWYRHLIPEHLRGRYNAPGWCGKGTFHCRASESCCGWSATYHA